MKNFILLKVLLVCFFTTSCSKTEDELYEEMLNTTYFTTFQTSSGSILLKKKDGSTGLAKNNTINVHIKINGTELFDGVKSDEEYNMNFSIMADEDGDIHHTEPLEMKNHSRIQYSSSNTCFKMYRVEEGSRAIIDSINSVTVSISSKDNFNVTYNKTYELSRTELAIWSLSGGLISAINTEIPEFELDISPDVRELPGSGVCNDFGIKKSMTIDFKGDITLKEQ